MDSWAYIPSTVLLQILEYLNRRDRFSCGLVCKQWYSTMRNPLLWKKFVVCLDTELTDPLTFVIAKRFGKHISSLDLTWSKSYLPRRWIRNRMTIIVQHTYHFLMFIKDCNINLTTFKLNDWHFTWKYKKVIFHLTTFLRQQRRLQYVNLSNAYLNKTEILKILFACQYSSVTLKQLDLLEAFHEWQHNIFMNPSFAIALQQFKNLEVLKLDYSSISDRTLSAFIRNGNTELKWIEICVKDVDSRSHVLSSFVWAKLVQHCKELKVALRIYHICHYEEIFFILIHTMPLDTFVLTCGNSWDQNRSRNYCGIINLLLNNFGNTLTHLTLLLKHNREMIDKHLFDLINKCKTLRYFEFDGVLRNINFFNDICPVLHEDSINKYKYFHVKPRNLNIQNSLILSLIWRNYVKNLLEENLCFEIECYSNPVVRILC